MFTYVHTCIDIGKYTYTYTHIGKYLSIYIDTVHTHKPYAASHSSHPKICLRQETGHVMFRRNMRH